MILIDANLLLYAHLSKSEAHEAARRWLTNTLSGPLPVGLAWTTVLAFLRISTHPSLSGRPLRTDEAASVVQSWLERPNVEILAPGERHWEILRALLVEAQVRGPLTSDAHLAALALEHGATLYTCDRDFARFPGLRFKNPLSRS